MEGKQDNPMWKNRYQFRFNADDHELLTFLGSLDATTEKGLHTTVLKHLAFLGFKVAEENKLLDRKRDLATVVTKLKEGESTISLLSSLDVEEEVGNGTNTNQNSIELQLQYAEMQKILIEQNAELMKEKAELIKENTELKMQQQYVEAKQLNDNTSLKSVSYDDRILLEKVNEIKRMQLETHKNTNDILGAINGGKLVKVDEVNAVQSKSTVLETNQDVKEVKKTQNDEIIEEKDEIILKEDIIEEKDEIIVEDDFIEEDVIIEEDEIVVEEDVIIEEKAQEQSAKSFVKNLPFDINAIANSMKNIT